MFPDVIGEPDDSSQIISKLAECFIAPSAKKFPASSAAMAMVGVGSWPSAPVHGAQTILRCQSFGVRLY